MRRLLFALLLLCAGSAFAHVGGHPSIHDTIATVVDRLRGANSADALKTLSLEQVLAVLSEEDRHVLGTEFWTFMVDVPVTVSILLESRQDEIPLWLKDEGFKRTDYSVAAGKNTFTAYQKDFDAGEVGLGYPGFDVLRAPYFVSLAPKTAGAPIAVTQMYPGRHEVATLAMGATIFVDEDDAVSALSKELDGAVLLRGVEDRAKETRLLRVFRTTDYVATETPDHVVLTWNDDPRTTQAIQWRTAPTVNTGFVRYAPASQPDATRVLPAEQTVLTDTMLANDPVNHRYTVTLRDLRPGTEYRYEVATTEAGPWSAAQVFRTAPDKVEPFKFVYMGDAQNGLDTWGKLLAKANGSEPDARFYIMAGDLVNRGIERDDWDSFFANAKGTFDTRQLVPCLGNHECQGNKGPWMYLGLFDLPKNGPTTLTPEHAYSFNYSNALFVVLDSNLEPETQTAWLEQQLAGSNAKWKFVVYHHPAYVSSPSRETPALRPAWTALFDKYHVDLALQGHDHAYLRTYPMLDQKRVASPAEGTIYIVSVSGTKFYEQGQHDYTEFGMTNIATYQVLDITLEDNRLVYKAYDIDGQVRDEFVITK